MNMALLSTERQEVMRLEEAHFLTWEKKSTPAAAAAQEEAGDTLATAEAAAQEAARQKATDKLAHRRLPLLSDKLALASKEARDTVRRSKASQDRSGGRAAARYQPAYYYKWQDYKANMAQRGHAGARDISCSQFLCDMEEYDAREARETLLREWEERGGSYARAAELARGFAWGF